MADLLARALSPDKILEHRPRAGDDIYPDGKGQNIGCESEGPAWYIQGLVSHKLYHCTQREVRFFWGIWHTSRMGN